MADVDLIALAASLYARRDTAVVVPYAGQDLTWTPRPNDCHNNSDRFVMENEGFESIRGWRVFDYSDMGLYRFMAHTVIAAPDGRLFDITPNTGGHAPRFLRHEGPEGEFEGIVEAGSSTLSHPLRHAT